MKLYTRRGTEAERLLEMFKIYGLTIEHPHQFLVEKETVIKAEYESPSKALGDVVGWKYRDTSFVVPSINSMYYDLFDGYMKMGVAVQFQFKDLDTATEWILITGLSHEDRVGGDYLNVEFTVKFLEIHEG